MNAFQKNRVNGLLFKLHFFKIMVKALLSVISFFSPPTDLEVEKETFGGEFLTQNKSGIGKTSVSCLFPDLIGIIF